MCNPHYAHMNQNSTSAGRNHDAEFFENGVYEILYIVYHHHYHYHCHSPSNPPKWCGFFRGDVFISVVRICRLLVPRKTSFFSPFTDVNFRQNCSHSLLQPNLLTELWEHTGPVLLHGYDVTDWQRTSLATSTSRRVDRTRRVCHAKTASKTAAVSQLSALPEENGLVMTAPATLF